MADEILTTSEIEHIIENFKPCSLEDIGSSCWFKARDKLCKLYQVAIVEVRTEGPERIKSALSVYSRLTDFVKELLTISVWIEKVLPEVLAFSPRPEQSFPTYIILYSEVMLVGLLEALLFHGEMFWDLGEMCQDLIDYAVDKVVNLDAKGSYADECNDKTDYDALSEIKRHQSVMQFTIGTSCITILRFVAENFDKMSLSAASRLYTHYDVPLAVARIIDSGMWSYKKEGRLYKYENNKWREWRSDDPILSHVECQTWLLIRQLLLNTTCDTIYYYSDYRKENLSKLTRHLYDSVIDQLSPLADLKIWLHRLSISNPNQEAASSNPLIIEMSESYHDKLLNQYKGEWNKLAVDKARLLLYPKQDDIVKLARSFAGGLDGMEVVAENIYSCNLCYSKALKRCSKCKKVWYCSRKCQVEHWKVHKEVCCQ